MEESNEEVSAKQPTRVKTTIYIPLSRVVPGSRYSAKDWNACGNLEHHPQWGTLLIWGTGLLKWWKKSQSRCDGSMKPPLLLLSVTPGCRCPSTSLGMPKVEPQPGVWGTVPPPHAAPAPQPGCPAPHHPLRGAHPCDSSPGEAQTNTIFPWGFIADPTRLDSTVNSGLIPVMDEARAHACSLPGSCQPKHCWGMGMEDEFGIWGIAVKKGTRASSPLSLSVLSITVIFQIIYPFIHPSHLTLLVSTSHPATKASVLWMFSSLPSQGHPEKTLWKCHSASEGESLSPTEAQATSGNKERHFIQPQANCFNPYHYNLSLVHTAKRFGGKEGMNETELLQNKEVVIIKIFSGPWIITSQPRGALKITHLK